MRACPHCEHHLADEAVTCRYCDELMTPPGEGRFDVVLLYPGCRGLEIIGAVSDLTSRSSRESRRLVLACRDAPQQVFAGASLSEAEAVWRRLKRTGATAEIRLIGSPTQVAR